MTSLDFSLICFSRFCNIVNRSFLLFSSFFKLTFIFNDSDLNFRKTCFNLNMKDKMKWMVDINYFNRSVDLKMTVIFIFGFLEISGSFFSLLSIIIFPLAILGSEYLLFVNKAMLVFFIIGIISEGRIVQPNIENDLWIKWILFFVVDFFILYCPTHFHLYFFF